MQSNEFSVMQRKTKNFTYSLSERDGEKLKEIQRKEGIHSRSETIRRIIDREHMRLIVNESKNQADTGASLAVRKEA